MSQPKAMQVKPLVSSVNEQDFTSNPIPLSTILFTTFVGIFFGIAYIANQDVPGVGLFLLIPSVWFCGAFLSMHRLRVNHTMDELVFDSIFLGCRYWRKRKKLSDSLYLRCHKTVSTDENNQTSTHYIYIIHGNSGKKRDWKLNISNMMRGKPNNNKAKEIAKSIGIKFKSR
jgi:hypothetical protein